MDHKSKKATKKALEEQAAPAQPGAEQDDEMLRAVRNEREQCALLALKWNNNTGKRIAEAIRRRN